MRCFVGTHGSCVPTTPLTPCTPVGCAIKKLHNHVFFLPLQGVSQGLKHQCIVYEILTNNLMKKLFYLFTILFAGLFAACDNGQYVDLGLPSGTLWYSKNEGGDHTRYTYDEAISNFGSKLPTKEQLEELKNQCTWTWTGSGYKVVGPNGNSIYLPAAGWRSCDGNVSDVGSFGVYWSSTPEGSDSAYYLVFDSNFVIMDNYFRCHGLSVRLVQD